MKNKRSEIFNSSSPIKRSLVSTEKGAKDANLNEEEAQEDKDKRAALYKRIENKDMHLYIFA